MAENGEKGLKMAGCDWNSWKWLKWLDIAGMAGIVGMTVNC